MSDRPSSELLEIGPEEFVRRLQNGIKANNRYAFLLGAGCSVTSGIPTAGQLVRDDKRPDDWLRDLRYLTSNNRSDTKIDEWAWRTLSRWNPDNPAGSYGELIERLFLTDGERQREIERICEQGVAGTPPKPSLGYILLSGLIDKYRGQLNVVLTTNFDDLLADAAMYFYSYRPLVIHHDSLAPFIRPTHERPIIIKLHGDCHLAPRNTAKETAKLAQAMADRVKTVLHDRGLIVMGYGGNDQSVLQMFESLPAEALQFGIYWVSGREPRGLFRAWLESRHAVWVRHGDFDSLMNLMRIEFDIDDPKGDRLDGMLKDYKALKEKLAVEIQARASKEDKKDSVTWWDFEAAASAVENSDPAAADQIYQLGIRAFPDSAELLCNYAVFFESVRREPDLAEKYYIQALGANPKHAHILGNYATFLETVRKSPDQAEEYYQRAIEADPKNARNLGNFAVFLDNVRKTPDRAEEYFQRAIEADPKHARNLGFYAVFLQVVRKSLDRAEEYYQRAIEADPKNARNLGNFAVFLDNVRKTPDRAEEYFQRAIEADPKHARNLGFYAVFLQVVRKSLDRAEEYYQRAIEADPKHASNLGNYALFLQVVRKSLDRAEEYYQRAIEADPQHARNLGNFASFLNYVRKTPDRAEEYYQRAIEADPKNASNLGNFAVFLNNVRNTPDLAEEFYKRAIEADPKHANNLGNYASHLLGNGRVEEGLEKLCAAWKEHSPSAEDDIALELSFYSYAFEVAAQRPEWLRKIKSLLSKGIRSPGWDMSGVADQAIKAKHPEKKWLKKLADVISEAADISTLDGWGAWQKADKPGP